MTGLLYPDPETNNNDPAEIKLFTSGVAPYSIVNDLPFFDNKGTGSEHTKCEYIISDRSLIFFNCGNSEQR